jgi:hypothetical protein
LPLFQKGTGFQNEIGIRQNVVCESACKNKNAGAMGMRPGTFGRDFR